MGRIPAALGARIPASAPATDLSETETAHPRALDARRHRSRLIAAPLNPRLAGARRGSTAGAVGRVGLAAVIAIAALLAASALFETHAVAATAVLVLAVMLGAWRGFWLGAIAALLTAGGLALLVATVDRSRAPSLVDAGAFLVVAVLILVRCSRQERRTSRLLRAALHDPLTGLPNRAALLHALRHACADSARGGPAVALICLDVDDFKGVNDGFGHGAGDELLCAVAARLAARLRPGDLAARQGGDEFALLLTPGTSLDNALIVAGRVLAALDEPFLLRGQTVRVTASAGVACIQGVEARAERLLEQADAALYRAKHGGKARAVVYRSEYSPVAQAGG